MLKPLFLCLSLLSLTLHSAPAKGRLTHKGNFGVAGWVVYWDPTSLQVVEKQADLIDRLYPEWYIIGTDGLPQDAQFNYKPGKERDDFLAAKKRTIELAKAKGIQVIYMIVNFDKDKFEHSSARVQKFLYDPAIQKKHIQILVENAVKDGAAGIDIDYENLLAKDAAPFSAFMAQLRKACDAKGLLLAAALAPKVSAAGTWDGNQAHDYSALGQSLDLIRPMTYDERWATSTAGPVSSPEFSEMVDRYAVSVTSPDKVELGLAGYGYDWAGNKGVSIGWADLQERIAKKGLKMTRDPETAELRGRYKDAGVEREVWFCDAGSYKPKFAIIKKYKLAGLAMWRFGTEDPAFWDEVKKAKFEKGW